jgi:hypothetical protein
MQGAAQARYLRVMISRHAICWFSSAIRLQHVREMRREDTFEGFLGHDAYEALETMTLLKMEKVHSEFEVTFHCRVQGLVAWFELV